MKDRKLLETLLETPSPSGYEIDIQKKLIDELKEIDDTVIKQQNCNVVHVLNPNSETRILFAAHIDEIGLYIKKINADGTCAVGQIGNVRPYMYLGQRVRILTGEKDVFGVIGYLPQMDKGVQVKDFILDLGVSSKEEAEKTVSVGNAIVVDGTYRYLANGTMAARALDNKISVYIFAELLKRIKGKTDIGIYFAATVGEETTGRGAASAVQSVKPNCAIAIDVTSATDVRYRDDLVNDIKLGGGVCLTEGSLMNKVLHKEFLKLAKLNNIPYQIAVESSKTYTDIDYMYDFNSGTPCYLMSVPLRYMHSSVETCDLNDVDGIIDLLEQFVLNYKKNTSFDPFED